MEPNADVNTNPAGNQTMPLPENNVVPAGQPEAIVSTPVNIEPVAPTPKTSGDGTMTTPIIEPPKKKSRAMLLCVILLALVAIGGIVFGVVTMAQKNQQAKDYDSQIATLKKANVELLEAATNEAEAPVEESETVVVVEPTESVVAADTEKYVYVGEWGLKIRIPDELKMAGYTFSHYKNGDLLHNTIISVTGITQDVDVLPDFVRKTTLGSVNRFPKSYNNGECAPSTSLVFADDDYNFCYGHPQAVYSTDADEQAMELEAVNVIQNMLQNVNNYSAI